MGIEILIGGVIIIAIWFLERYIFTQPTKVYYFEPRGFHKERKEGHRVIGPERLVSTFGRGGVVYFSKGYLETRGAKNIHLHRIDIGERSIKDDVALIHGGYIVDGDYFNNIHMCWLELDDDDVIVLDKRGREIR